MHSSQVYPFPATVVSVAGRDRCGWLNNLVTNDLRRLSEAGSVECFATDVKGRTLAHGLVFAETDQLHFLSWGIGQGPKLMTHWDRYIIREDVQLADSSQQARWYVLSAAAANAIFASASPAASASVWSGKSVLREGDWLGLEHPALGSDWRLLRLPPASTIEQAFSQAKLGTATTLSEEEVTWHRLQQAWPIVGVDFDERNLPQELDRDAHAISFHKGCYLGQETVARLDALGQVQKKLVRLTLDPARLNPAVIDRLQQPSVAAGTKVEAGDQEAGVVTSFASNPERTRAMGLAYIKRAYLAPTTAFAVAGLPMIMDLR
jgi:folate-binding protein YgfZ